MSLSALDNILPCGSMDINIVQSRTSGCISCYISNQPSPNITKTVNGVSTKLDSLNKHFFSSDSYADLVKLNLQEHASSSFKYTSLDSDDESSVYKFKDCLNSLIDLSKRSMTLQRYKGLGEMNPSQLEETTMNTKSRSLLKVLPLEDLNQVVVELMGDDVEPRREFIKQKYSSVKNLDI